ncbi:hypothetical protein UFOVP786_36 [uncultured Caudovirales phage]|uniref:Uncharacterized protein n=1 Tax=uncultured Caudovirales phage TaxID=2100421 RepID=A0A6J5NZD3_9CAUD|nr:hypothetical protein UFOVP786_36 [uncultured Caudovirales phage]
MKFVTNAMPYRLPELERAHNAIQFHKGEPPIVRLVTKAPVAGSRFTAEELKEMGFVSVWKEDIPQTE